MKTWTLLLSAVASAICTLLSSAPFGFGLAAIVAPMLLLSIVLYARSTRSAMFFVFITQIPLWLWLHRWVYDIAGVGWIGIGLYMSIWAPLFVGLLRKVQAKLQVSLVISAPILWVGIECVRGIIIFEGYPWYLAGTGIVDWPLASIATIGGVWIASLLVVILAAVLITIKNVRWWTWVSLSCVCVFFLFYGSKQLKHTDARIDVGIIQTNVPQSNKIAWTWERQLEDVEQAIAMTRLAMDASDAKPALIVWPETMLPGSGFELTRVDFGPWDEQLMQLWYWSEKIKELSEELNVPILVGTQTWLDVHITEHVEYLEVVPSAHYNSAVLVNPDGSTNRYDKMFLTPFGERIPYVEYFPAVQDWIREKVAASMLFDLDAGGEPKVFSVGCETAKKIPDTIAFSTPICFEDTVPKVIRELIWDGGKRKVDLLINLSNDGWFGNDDGARIQHVREARMRCIENMTPMLRSVNTGMSCSINQSGDVREVASIHGKVAIRKPSVMSARVFAFNGLPLSRFVGDSVAWLSLIGSILLVIGSCKKWSKDSNEGS